MKTAFIYSIIMCGIAYIIGFAHGLRKRDLRCFVMDNSGSMVEVTETEFWDAGGFAVKGNSPVNRNAKE